MDLKSISVIIQGPTTYRTFICIKSVKKYLPESEIILSTWENTDKYDLEDLEKLCDKVILNKDPGAAIANEKILLSNNINRMLLTTKTGLSAATRSYVLKLRSDMEIKNLNFIGYFEKKLKRIDKFKLFKERILAYPHFSSKFYYDGNIFMMKPYNISDWCFFALREDALRFYDVDLVKEPDFSKYLENNIIDSCHISLTPGKTWQYPPEQYITYSCAKKNFPEIEIFNSMIEWNDKIIEQSEIFIVNNFKVLTHKEWGIVSNKHDVKKINNKSIARKGMYTNYWYSDYKKYCDNNYKLTFLQKLYRSRLDNNFYDNFIQCKSCLFSKYTSIARKIIYLVAMCYFITLSVKEILWNKDYK